MQATSQAIPPTPLFYLNLLIRLNQTLKYGYMYHDYNQELSLSQDRVEIVGWRNTNICKEMKGDFGFTEDRQYRCSSLYQSYGQDGVFRAYIVNTTQKLWVWCLERNIQLTAQHIPERLNSIADSESQTMIDCSDWKVDTGLFRQTNRLYGQLQVDFASRLTNQLPTFHS